MADKKEQQTTEFSCSRLSVISSVRQAYSCLWHYKIQHVMISIVAVLPFFLAGLLGALDAVFSVTPGLQDMPEGFNLSFAILVLTTFFWAIPVIILWHRLYLLGPEHLIRKKIWPLITRSLRLISHSLIFFGMGLVAAVIITWGIFYLRMMSDGKGMLGTITEMGQLEYALYIFGVIIILSFLMIISLRLSMTFSALTIGKPLRFTTSWRMTRRNTLPMLLATFIGGVPLVAVDIALLRAAEYYLDIDLWAGTAPDPEMIYIFVLVAAPVLTLPLAILCSLTSAFYRHCGCAEYSENSE